LKWFWMIWIWIWPEHRVFASMCLTSNQMSEKESYATSRWTFRKLTFLVPLAVSLLLFIQSPSSLSVCPISRQTETSGFENWILEQRRRRSRIVQSRRKKRTGETRKSRKTRESEVSCSWRSRFSHPRENFILHFNGETSIWTTSISVSKQDSWPWKWIGYGV